MKYRYVLHGSHAGDFEIVQPKRNIRIQFPLGKETVVFNQMSFHASPLYWIALAYTYNRGQVFMHNGVEKKYSMGVNLYNDTRTIRIYGTSSLEESLEKLYGNGGYIYFFNKDSFFHTEGLGDLELICNLSVKPDAVQFIKNPLQLFEKLNISFDFHDASRDL